MIIYKNNPQLLEPNQLGEFFQGWLHRPDRDMHLDILKKSTYVIYAWDEESNQVVGFVTAVSDQRISAYIPLLEVLPAFQGQGIGTKLMQLILEEIGDIYMIDLCCDKALKEFYQKLGFSEITAMSIRKYKYQSGKV